MLKPHPDTAAAAPRSAGLFGRLHPLDMLSLAYLAAVSLLIIVFHDNLENWHRYIVYHVIAGCIILGLVAAEHRTGNPVLHLLRTVYPVLGFGFAWLELDVLFTLIFPFYGTDLIIAWDRLVFGVHPTVWVETLFSYPLTEVMNFFYAVYFLFLPAGTLIIYFRQGRPRALDFLFLVFSAYFSVFLFTIFFPVEGAWTALKDMHTQEPEGGFFLRLNHFIQSHGSVKGGAFPSVHVTGAFAVAAAGLKYEKKFGMLIMLLAPGVALSTVYCRYHHALDAAAGILWGLAAAYTAAAILEKIRRSKGPADPE